MAKITKYIPAHQLLRVVFAVAVVLLYGLMFSSCEKDITVDLPEPEIKIVVEGAIEANAVPYVYLTKNAPYFSSVDAASLEKLIVHDAVVTVSDGTNTFPLQEIISGGKKTGVYFTFALIGQFGKYYTLNVEAEGKKLWAVTKIPVPVPLDSASFKPDTPGDSLGRITGFLTDPDSVGNYYRLMTKRLNKKYVKDSISQISFLGYAVTGGSVYEDRFFNGKNYEVRISRGSVRNDEEENDDEENRERGRFKVGDTVSVKWISIDKNVYDFYRTMQSANNGGNPFASPVTVRSNVKGDGLGVWAGYGATFKTVIAK